LHILDEDDGCGETPGEYPEAWVGLGDDVMLFVWVGTTEDHVSAEGVPVSSMNGSASGISVTVSSAVGDPVKSRGLVVGERGTAVSVCERLGAALGRLVTSSGVTITINDAVVGGVVSFWEGEVGRRSGFSVGVSVGAAVVAGGCGGGVVLGTLVLLAVPNDGAIEELVVPPVVGR